MERKLEKQARAISLLGLNMDVFYINFGRQLKDNSVVFYRRSNKPLHRVSSTLLRYASIPKHIDTDGYDLLVLRYAGGDCSVLSPFFVNNREKIVTEHHTKEMDEAFTYATTFLQKALTLSMEKWLGPRMIGKCRGLIGVTDEIKEYELQRASKPIPACTVPNGVLVQDIPFSKHASYDGTVLRLVCLANAFEPWQGLDRVLAGLKNYTPRRPFVHLKVVGHVPDRVLKATGSINGHSNNKVDFLGRLYGSSLERVVEDAHMAFSSLAVFRKGMREACALKTREFIARGLPFVIGYRDPDLLENQEFFLPIAPDDSPVNMEEVVSFAERVLTRKGVSESMRQYANERLDWKIKMQDMWDFLQSVNRGKDAVRT